MPRVFILGISMISQLAGSDWLMIQGTEPDRILKEGEKVRNSINTPSFWGFAQLKYEKNYSNTVDVSGINKSAFAYVAPNLERQNQLQLLRARLGLRGILDDENRVNYFILTDFGHNGISDPLGHSQHTYITDASMTLRYIPYANVRLGLFKYPGSEEGIQARFASPFIQFTQMSNFLLFEKTPKTDRSLANTAGSFTGGPERSVGAYRDTGIEIFEQFRLNKKWTLSYAVMIGNGSGLEWENKNEGEYTGYGYTALEYSFDKGKGYYHQDLKTYLWYQEGKRALEANDRTELYDRIRYGAGLRYYKDGLRLEAEYTSAKGMLYAGPVDTDARLGEENWHYSIEAPRSNKAYGYYLASAYEFYPKLEAILRYDELDNLRNAAAKERVFKTMTVGLSYHFQGLTRLDLNYLFRDAKAPGNTAAQTILDNMGDIVTLQFTYKFGMRL